MLATLVICLVALLASLLTFFSGFGLGTLLTPVFMLFFPVEIAIALTGVVHFFNGLFKVALVGKYLNKYVLLRFGIPAILCSFAGALLLMHLSKLPHLYDYSIGNQGYHISLLKLVLGPLLIGFALLDLLPTLKKITFNNNKLIIGGMLSGFFGGLSGHQGALRSAFLTKANLSKEAFVGTGTVIGTFIDFSRIFIYMQVIQQPQVTAQWKLLICAIVSATTGAFIGAKLLKKITLKFIQQTVGILLILVGVCLTVGLL